MIDDESFVAGVAVLHPGEILGGELMEPLETSQNVPSALGCERLQRPLSARGRRVRLIRSPRQVSRATCPGNRSGRAPVQ